MSSLSKRLRLIGTMVPDGARVCDVGTDHGYLPAAHYKSGRVSSVTATDIREKPLENARKNLARLGADGVRLILCDGLAGVCREDVDTVIVAGMGAEVICGILARCAFVRDGTVTLLLQPMTSAELLRDYLAREGFRVLCEPTVEDGNRFYSVMKARFDGVQRELTPTERYAGLVTADSVSGRKYLEKQYRRLRDCQAILVDRPEEQEKYSEYAAAAKGIQQRLEDTNAV